MGLSIRDLCPVDVGLRGDLLLRVVHALPLLLWLGSVEEGSGKMGPLGPRYPSQPLGYGGDADRQFLAHIHDESARRGYPGYGSRNGAVLERICERDVDADQYPPVHSQHRVRWRDRRGICCLPLPFSEN